MTIKSNKYYKWEVLGLLWLAFFLNQADRQVFNVVLPLIQDDLKLTDVEMGMIASAFILTLALCVPFAGIVGDLFSRKWITTLTVIFWSIATVLTGLAMTPMHLVLFRSVATGGGEAFFAPANYALIAQYHKKTRSLALSIHQTSLYAGVVISGFLAAYIAEIWGWRSSFYVFGAAGVLLGIIMIFRLKDKREVVPVADIPITQKKPAFFKILALMIKRPTFLLLTLAFAGMVFVNIGYLTWMPTFLYEKFNMSLPKAGFVSMFYMHGFAFIGVILGGRLSDKFVVRNRNIRLLLQIVGMLFGAPFIVLMGLGNTTILVYIGLAGFGFFRGLYDANIYASLYDIIEPEYRSTASGIMIMFAFITGAASPMILGMLKPTLGLTNSIALLSILACFSAACIFIAMKFYFKKDYYHGLEY